MKTINEKISSGYYKNTKEYPKTKKLPENTIIDEDRSVRWNKEEVIRLNEEQKLRLAEYTDETRKLEDEFDKDVVESIMENWGFNVYIAKKILSKAFIDGHSGGHSEVYNMTFDLAEFAEEILKLSKEA